MGEGRPRKAPRVHAGNALYMRSKREQEREYMRTYRTMPVISFTSSELEDYQLQLVLRSVDQIASQFVHRLFFLAPLSSSSSSSSRSPFLRRPTSFRAHAPFFFLSNLAPYCGPSARSRSTKRKTKSTSVQSVTSNSCRIVETAPLPIQRNSQS